MSSKTNYLPTDFHSITPFLVLSDAAQAISFYQKAFAATELVRLTMPDGRVGYAELKIADSLILVVDEFPEMGGALSPNALNNTTVMLQLYVADVDEVFAKAIAEGATELRPIQDQFFGDRAGTLKDPFGHHWNIATNQEKISRAELKRRFDKMMQQ
jgi:PhnB protein